MIPFISVIIPLYNKENSIISTIESVLAQSFGAFEVLIVDDGSTDSGADIVSAIDDIRIKVYKTDNHGVSHARNYGVKQATANYVAFLDADDYWYPNHLLSLSELIYKFGHAKWFATAYEIKHNKRMCLPMRSPVMENGDSWAGEVDDFFANSMMDCLAWTSAVCMDKNFFEKLGGFDLALRNMQDTDLWIRAALESKLVFSSRITARYILEGEAHISQKHITYKTVMDFDKYELQAQGNVSLKRYLDLNRYSVALRYKFAGRSDMAQLYVGQLDFDSLSVRQKYIVRLPVCVLQGLDFVKRLFEGWSIRVRSN